MIRRPPRSTQSRSSAASDVYKRQLSGIPKLKNWNVDKKYSAILILFVVFIVGSVFMPSLWSGAYYKLNVVSSEQQVQMAYIEDSINYTRAAYGLTDIDETYYPNTVELNN